MELYTYYFVSHSIICFVVIFGNLATLLCFVKYRKLQKQRYALICSLAVSDLVVGVSSEINILCSCTANLYNAPTAITGISVYCFILLLMSSIYGKIWHVAHVQHNKILAQQQMSHKQMNLDANKTVLIILCSFACLYLPNIFVCYMETFGQTDARIMPVITIIALGCMFANSGVNVFIYALFTHDFKVIFRELFRCKRNEINAMPMCDNIDIGLQVALDTIYPL